MLNLIIGIILVIAGAWGILANWMLFADVLKMLISLGLIGFGVIALLAGLRRLKAAK